MKKAKMGKVKHLHTGGVKGLGAVKPSAHQGNSGSPQRTSGGGKPSKQVSQK